MEENTIQGFPLSPPQQHLWRLGARGDSDWNVGLRVAVEGSLEAGALQEVLQRLVDDQEILRTGFATLPGTHVGVQVIAERADLDFAHIELTSTDEAKLAQLFSEALARPFASDKPSEASLRAVLVSLPDATHELFLVQPALSADSRSLWNLAALLTSNPNASPASSDVDEEDEDGPMQYADLAEWLQEMFEGEEAPEGLGFWRRVDLSGVSSVRTPFEGKTGGDFAPDRIAVPFSNEKLQSLAESLQQTPESVLFACWQELLARHTDRDDLIVGYASAGRSFEGLDVALGHFQRTLPILMDRRAGDDLKTRAQRSSQSIEEAQEWHELWDLERLRQDTQPVCLPYAFELHPHPPEASGNGLQLRAKAHRGQTDRFHLKLEWDQSAGELALAFDRNTVDRKGAGCLAEQLSTLLEAACASPQAPSGSLGIQSEAERARVLQELCRSAPSEDIVAAHVHERILQHAKKQPNAPAAVGADGSLTYGELEARANQLARHLIELGVGPGQFVGIAMSRSTEWSVAILATLLAGGAYLPLPANYPSERIGFMLSDTAAPVVLTQRADVDRIPDSSAELVVLDELDLGAKDAGPVTCPAGSADPAYIIYTSGSTGQPKGVPISHANLAFSTEARHRYYKGELGAYLLLSSFAFDSSIVGVFWTLTAGGKLVLPAEGEETDLKALAEWIEKEQVTHTLALPSLWSVLLEETPSESLASLTTVMVAGESCHKDLPGRHFDKLLGCGLFNEYGPTEGTVWCTVHDCSEASDRPQIPIGRPIPGAEVFVRTEDGDLAPLGIAGEILLGGPGVAAGYHGRAELTAERFVPHPFGSSSPARLYRTGDLGRLLPDGTLEFLGRIDHQVKIRGFRVELGEIETTLAQHPGIQDAVVHALEDANGGKRLIAYVIHDETVTSLEELRTYLAGPLPEYMIPAHFVQMDAFPLLPNGKVDRKRLPEPTDSEASKTAYVAPSTPLETVLAELWAEVLDVERVGVEHDFFALGGHSILATQLFARMTDTLDVRIALRALFEARTVRGLAERILADVPDAARVERTAELLTELLASEEEEEPST